MLKINTTKIAKVLPISIDGKTYKLPLADSLPVGIALKLRKAQKTGDENEVFDVYCGFLGNYLGDTFEKLSVSDLTTIIEAWDTASQDGELGLGE